MIEYEISIPSSQLGFYLFLMMLSSIQPKFLELPKRKDKIWDKQKPAKDGTLEAWGRSEQNPVGGWYGLKKGFRGRFGMYIPPLIEALRLVELTHNAKGNQMRAL